MKDIELAPAHQGPHVNLVIRIPGNRIHRPYVLLLERGNVSLV